MKENIDTSKGIVLLSTVKGDIHDIGKNIVGAVLESRGFTILDLGKNVNSDEILRNLEVHNDVNIIGLSALMTTTMGEMGNVNESLDKQRIKIPVIVGGAVVTGKFAGSIGADGYGADGFQALAVVENLNSSTNE